MQQHLPTQQQQTRPQRSQDQQRVPQGSSQAQGQEKPVLEFFHATNGGGKFKKLTLSVSQRGGVLVRLSEKEGDGAI